MHNIMGLQHIGLPVCEMEASVAFYERIGFKPVHRKVLDNKEQVKVTFMELKGLVLELCQSTGPEGAEIHDRNDGHWDHVALDVDDIDAVFREVKTVGWTVLEGEPQFLPFHEKGVHYFTVRGPGGEKVEFCQRLR